ncbi:MAG: hypothetical protein ABDI20_02000 [Candidatus Bipolaricaulaceae bacterium]
MPKTFILLVGVLAGVSLAAWATRVGLGLGLSEWGFGGGEVWAEFRPEAALAWRLGVVYVAPVLPAEKPGVGFWGGVRLAGGEAIRPLLSLGGGMWVEPTELRVPALGWVAVGTAGLEGMFGRWGFYVGASALLALRPLLEGVLFYPYFLYSVGVMWGR